MLGAMLSPSPRPALCCESRRAPGRAWLARYGLALLIVAAGAIDGIRLRDPETARDLRAHTSRCHR